MFKCGVTVYPDFHSIGEIEIYLRQCKSLGYQRMFTCMQLGDYGFENGKRSDDPCFRELFRCAKTIGMTTSADITDKVFEIYGATPSDLLAFSRIGLDILRLDGGFTTDQIIEMTNNEFGIKIELNASHILSISNGDDFFLEVKKRGKKENLLACFNFYPRMDTGQSTTDVVRTLKQLSQFKLETSAFIASQSAPSVLHGYGHGIMTIESHRFSVPSIAAQELAAIGIDTVMFGDAFASTEELESLIEHSKSDQIRLPIHFNEYVSEDLKAKICSTKFTTRGDQPDNVIRTQQLRGLNIKPNYCVPRKINSLTIDNNLSGRYSGEIQILLNPLPADRSVNVVGEVPAEASILFPYIQSEKNSFVFYSR